MRTFAILVALLAVSPALASTWTDAVGEGVKPLDAADKASFSAAKRCEGTFDKGDEYRADKDGFAFYLVSGGKPYRLWNEYAERAFLDLCQNVFE